MVRVVKKLGMKPVSAESVCKHFFNLADFKHNINALPLLLNYFERGCGLLDINREFFSDPAISPIVPEFLQWAVTGTGINSTRRCYEVLETYGDTVLKLAATLLAYWYKKGDKKAGEGDVENSKVVFVTNFHLFRVGYYNLRMHRHMRIMRDLEAKEWVLPMQKKGSFGVGVKLSLDGRLNACPGKAVADSVESMLGAHFLSNDSLYKTLLWIKQIKLVPMPYELIEKFSNFTESSFHHLRRIDLDKHCRNFNKEDCLSVLFDKYLSLAEVQQMPCSAVFKRRIVPLIESKERIFDLGSAINALTHLQG